MKQLSLKNVSMIIGGFLLLIFLLWSNPIAYNTGGNRTVVQQVSGSQYVRFEPGMFISGFFAKEYEWPNQISVTYQDSIPTYDFKDNGIEVGQINVMFSDGLTADIKGVAQFILPSDEKTMIALHNTHRTPQSLVQKRLTTFTKSALQSSAQLMSSDKHYGGGRTQMSQDYLDQMRNGVYVSNVLEKVEYDSVDKQTKHLYLATIQRDKKTGLPIRQPYPLAEFQITVADANAVDSRYQKAFYAKLEKIIAATTRSALARADLTTAQQEALTKKAQGEKELVEIEYATKKDQTKQVVEAETRVAVAKQDKLQQIAQYEAAQYEAKKRQTIADVSAYEKRTAIQADNALQMRTDAYVKVQSYWADAFSKYGGNIVPQIVSGGNGNTANGMLSFMETMGAKSALDLSYQLKPNNLGPTK